MDCRLPKSAKLRHRTLVNNLFREGRSLYSYPLRLIVREFSKAELKEMFCNEVPEGIDNVQFMVTVPKKKHRRAVDRVLLRRRIREAFRLSRYEFVSAVKEEGGEERYFSLAFIYLSDTIYDYKSISEKVDLLLNKLKYQLHGAKSNEKITD